MAKLAIADTDATVPRSNTVLFEPVPKGIGEPSSLENNIFGLYTTIALIINA